MNAKYQIFISSTFEDLKEERDQLIKATLEIDHIPIGMEMFNAADEEQWETIKRTIDQCDYYAVIVAHRYGSIDEATGLSYTEKEYNYAVSVGVPVIGFVIDSDASWPASQHEKDAAMLQKLADFKAKVKGKTVNFWANKDALNARFSAAIPKLIAARPRSGWVRSTEAASPEVTGELARLSRENAELRDQLATAKQSAALMPDLEISMLVIWGSYHVHTSGRDTAGNPTNSSTLTNGYRLFIDFKNVGNMASEKAKAIVSIPWEIIKEEDKLTDQQKINHFCKVELSIRENQRNELLGMPRNPEPPILLPGESKILHVNLLESYASCQDPIKYSIHPEHGYSKSGEVKVADIQVFRSVTV